MYSFLFKPFWIVLHILALGLAIAFINLGFWQLRRLEERQSRNALLETRLALEPQALDHLLTTYRSDLPDADDSSIAYRPTKVSGVFDSSKELLWRTSTNYEGQPGYFVLTPLLLADGRALLVNRGWVPFNLNQPPIKEGEPVSGTVELEGTIQLELKRPVGLLSALTPQDPPGPLSITAWIDTERLSAQMPYKLLPIYLELHQQTPAQITELPLPLKSPEFSPGPHLGYAIQWFAFTLIGVVGYGFLIQQTARRHKNQATAAR